MAAEVTVVIPAWNLGSELEGAVASVTAQDVAVDLLTVDNASEVEVPNLDGELLRLDRRVSVGAARNAGLTRVRTPFVLFLDADDRLLPGSLETLLRAFADETLATHALAIRGQDVATGHEAPWGFPPPSAYSLQRWPSLLAVANTATPMVPAVGAVLHRTDVVRAAGGFADRNFGEDWALTAVLGFLGRVRLSDTQGLLLRVRTDSLTSQYEKWAAIAGVRREIRRRLRVTPEVPTAMRLATPLLTPWHLAGALRRSRQRHRTALRGRPARDEQA
jgi:glycosyltransferase involved in cell wall biosynthesis